MHNPISCDPNIHYKNIFLLKIIDEIKLLLLLLLLQRFNTLSPDKTNSAFAYKLDFILTNHLC